MADVAANERNRNQPLDSGSAEESVSREVRGGFFDIYKPSQGYHTRVWTGVAAGAMICWFAHFLYEKFELVGSGAKTQYIQVGVAVATIVSLGLLTYWLLALNRRVCDFLIATEGEMKKVNWTSRKEIFGSTKVVIFVLIFMSIVLFVVDVLFMLFFNAIGVLKTGVTGVIGDLF